MRTLNLLSGVGIAIVGAWLAVTNLAEAQTEFTCAVPWDGPDDSCISELKIPARSVVSIEVYTIQKDGKDQDRPATFQLLDTENKDAEVHLFTLGARSTGLWVYESNVKMLVAKVRVNHPNMSKTIIRGRYSVK